MTGTSYSRRGFLGLTALAAAGAGLTACTGVSNDNSGGSSNGGSNKLRLFTYEDTSTIDNFKAQIAKFDQQNGTPLLTPSKVMPAVAFLLILVSQPYLE